MDNLYNEPDDILKIRDALTDDTIASVDDAARIRNAVKSAESRVLKLHDALTDETIFSVEDAKKVRQAAASPDDDILKLHDAITDETVFSVEDAKKVRVMSEAAVSSGAVKAKRQPKRKIMQAQQAQDEAFEEWMSGFEAAVNDKSKDESKHTDKNIDLSLGDTKDLTRDSVFDTEFEFSDIVDNAEYIFDHDDYQDQDDHQDRNERSLYTDRKRSDRRYDVRYSDRKDRDYYDRGYDDCDDDYRNLSCDDHDRDYRKLRYDDNYRDHQRRRYDDRDSCDHDSYDYDDEPLKSPFRFVPLVLVIALCVVGFIISRAVFDDRPIDESDYTLVNYTVTSSMTDEEVANDLEYLGLIDNKILFKIRCKLYDADYQDGTYQLSPCYCTEKLVNILSGYDYDTDD